MKTNKEFLTFSPATNEELKDWGLEQDIKVGDNYCLVVSRVEGNEKGNEIGLKFKKLPI